MFLGQYQHTLDYKSRLSIPKKFRQQLQTGAILTRGLDGCLFVYAYSDWKNLAFRMESLPLTGADARSFSRYLFSGATEVEFDALGRIVIPDYLKRYGGIEKDVVFIGVLNRIEIWSEKRWKLINKKVSSQSSEIAEKLSDSGI